MKQISSWHVGVAAEAFAAALFARYGYDVSVQYGANQPEYDLIAVSAKWLADHHKKTVFCLVQFQNTTQNEMPRVYLASPQEIADRMNATANGRGDTILYENHTWGSRAAGAGTTDCIPDAWRISAERLAQLFDDYGQ